MGGLITGIGEECRMSSVEERIQKTFVERLTEEKENLEKRLVDVNAVLTSLEEAPEITKVLEALNRLGY